MPCVALTIVLGVLGCRSGRPEHAETVAKADALLQEAEGRRGELALRCEPGDAEVVVDGVPQGVCDDFDGRPGRLSLGQGMRHVVVKKDGYWPYETWYQSGGAKASLSVTLRPRAPEGESR